MTKQAEGRGRVVPWIRSMSCAVTTATPEQARSKAASARACAAVALPVPIGRLGACLPLHSRAGGSCSGGTRSLAEVEGNWRDSGQAERNQRID